MHPAWRTIRDRLGARAQRWALRRQGRAATRLQLASRRIYILPTLPGLLYAALLATMLAGAMNYNNNLAFALAFLLAGFGIAGTYHCHGILAGLHLHCLGAEPVFAGDTLQVRFSLGDDAGVAREEVFLDWAGGGAVPGGVAAHATRTVRVPLPTQRRGLLALPALRLQTRAPLGLLRAWTWVHMEPRALVYPRPAARAPGTPHLPDAEPGSRLHGPGDDDFAGLRAYRPGDPPRRIAWRHYARRGEFAVRDYRGGDAGERIWFDWDATAGDADTRAARLARLVLDAGAGQAAWGLRLPGLSLGPARGHAHLHRCLASLAMAATPAEPG
ncbi:MAG: DUF58 domain-containing protein [Gammaproteobacteria bacterium]|nr:DUF58 domain-containing protein [Gammaproteobacteria bacterium]